MKGNGRECRPKTSKRMDKHSVVWGPKWRPEICSAPTPPVFQLSPDIHVHGNEEITVSMWD